MYRFYRVMLILALAIFALCGLWVVAAFSPVSIWAILGLLAVKAVKQGHGYLTAHGTARWADIGTLRRAGCVDG